MSTATKLKLLPSGTEAATAVAPPRHADPIHLRAGIPLQQAAQQVLSEMFAQFTCNLDGLTHTDDPELVHQARVAWRRWRSATRLFRPWLPTLPDRASLQPLLQAMGQLRDLDVARTETLPHWLPAFAQGQAERLSMVQQTQALLQASCQQQRQQLRLILADPATDLALLAHARWLHSLTASPEVDSPPIHSRWARERIDKLHRRLQSALQAAQQAPTDAQLSHQARLLAKRTRYSIETLNDLLPQAQAQRWARQASHIQQHIGALRDTAQALALLEQLQAPREVLAFMEGVTAGRNG